MPTTRPLFEQIDSWLEEIDTEKQASAKPKKGLSKQATPGVGETTHPVMDVSNDTEDAEEGARYKENTADIKETITNGGIDSAPEVSGSQEDQQFNIGLKQRSTGEDPSVETSSTKGTKEDSGYETKTTHPANAEDLGEKYSSMRLPKLLKLAEDRANSLLADLANDVFSASPRAQAQYAATSKTAAAPSLQKTATQTSAEAGYDVAAMLAQYEKIAADYIATAIKDAEFDADLVGNCIHAYRAKMAEGEEVPPPAEGEEPPMPPPEAMGGGMPPGMEGGMPPGAEGGMPPGMEGGMPPGAEGGMPPGGDALSQLGAASEGAPPMGAEGGMPPDDGSGGGQVDQQQAISELVAALGDLGIAPEELAQASDPQAAKLASVAKAFQRSGKYQVHEPKTAAQKVAREQIKNYIREIMGNH